MSVKLMLSLQKIKSYFLSSDWDWDLGLGTWDLEPGTWDLGIENRESRIENRESRIENRNYAQSQC